MKPWQTVLICSALLTSGYLFSARAETSVQSGQWHMITNSANNFGGAWLYNDTDPKVYLCASSPDYQCIRAAILEKKP